MIVTQRGIDLIKDSEGCNLEPYLCPAGIPTVGWGHTGSDVKMGRPITQLSADQTLSSDIALVGNRVTSLLNGASTNDNQFSALVSFAYNMGTGRLAGSTLLARHKAGDFTGAASEFGRWVHATVNGRTVTLPGLVRRRAEEARMYLGEL